MEQKELKESDNLWNDLGLESKNVTSVIETVRDVWNPSLRFVCSHWSTFPLPRFVAIPPSVC